MSTDMEKLTLSGTNEFNPFTDGVSMTSIIRDTTLQVRTRLEDGLVRKYARELRNGAIFPPILLANIDSKLFLIDGFHRHSAYHSAGMQEIPAIIEPISRRQALCRAAKANLGHGKPLNATERRTAFRKFIRGGGYRLPKNKWMSYRELAEALGGIGGHTTIRSWMAKDFPRIYQAMGDERIIGSSIGEPPRIDVEAENDRQAKQALTDALNFFMLLTHPWNRFERHEQALKLLEEMNKTTMAEPEF